MSGAPVRRTLDLNSVNPTVHRLVAVGTGPAERAVLVTCIRQASRLNGAEGRDCVVALNHASAKRSELRHASRRARPFEASRSSAERYPLRVMRGFDHGFLRRDIG